MRCSGMYWECFSLPGFISWVVRRVGRDEGHGCERRSWQLQINQRLLVWMRSGGKTRHRYFLPQPSRQLLRSRQVPQNLLLLPVSYSWFLAGMLKFTKNALIQTRNPSFLVSLRPFSSGTGQQPTNGGRPEGAGSLDGLPISQRESVELSDEERPRSFLLGADWGELIKPRPTLPSSPPRSLRIHVPAPLTRLPSRKSYLGRLCTHIVHQIAKNPDDIFPVIVEIKKLSSLDQRARAYEVASDETLAPKTLPPPQVASSAHGHGWHIYDESHAREGRRPFTSGHANGEYRADYLRYHQRGRVHRAAVLRATQDHAILPY